MKSKTSPFKYLLLTSVGIVLISAPFSFSARCLAQKPAATIRTAPAVGV